MKKVLALFLAALLGMAALTGCSGSEGNDGDKESSGVGEDHKLRVGVLAAMTALPAVDIVNNGLDEENGIDIELVKFTTGSPMNEAMAAGELDVSFIGSAAVFSLANNDSKMICEICTDTVAIELVARSDSDIVKAGETNSDYPGVLGSADSIKGKTILCPAGTLSQFEVSKYLSVFGLTTDDVNFVPMEYAQAYQAFKTGEGDILATRSPQTYTAVDEEGWTSIATMKNLKADATAQIVASADAYDNKREALTTLVSLVAESGDKLNADVDYAAELMSDWFEENGQDIDLEVSRRQLEVKPFYGVEDMKSREFGSDFKNTLVEFYIESDQLEKDMKDTVNNNVKNDILVDAGLNE